ncbi:MAG: molybdopterin-dependent oxidoreductase [Giesbergeria sp.]|jgi:assimilatory nitrate reductase catalytic subunit|nr:molybdopterin-dependent oxidoreductase [Giesbergeria sp.]
MQETQSTCPYCGVGCGVIIESDGDTITGVRGDPGHPANFGRLCSKGASLHHTASRTVTLQTRLLQPMQRMERGAAPQAIGWDAALDLATERFARTIATHGSDAVGFYISGQLLTEDYYVFNKLAKGLIGTNNIDTNSRLCMSSAVAGFKQTLGADAPPACYDDLAHAQCLFIIGSNTAWAHPVLFRRIEDARRANPRLKIIVADPRRTDTAEVADLHLPLQPGSDVRLLGGMLHLMQREGWLDAAYIAAHTTGFGALQGHIAECTPERVALECGISPHDLLTAARWFAGLEGGTGRPRTPTLSLYCQGLNQSRSGTAKNAALVHLHLATGQIGQPGAGPLSLTGQSNAMGGREVGGMANLLSAHRDLANPAHRAEVAALWGVPDVPARPGRTAVEMFQAAADGEIKALWIACTNPAQSLPDQATVRRALQRAEFVVVQEAFATTATCQYADLLLPASTWGEKTGTVTNSERRISRVRSAVPAPGEARHDWQIAVQFAHRLEARLRPGQPTLFPYPTAQADAGAEAIWNEHRESTRGRDLDITGLSYARIDAQGPQQWPCPDPARTGPARLYEDGLFPTPNGRARFVPLECQGVAEPRSTRHPFSLITGRLRDQWHGMSRTGTLAPLFGHASEPALQMHAADMAAQGLHEGDLAYVTSARGSIVVPVQAGDEMAPGQVFLAMHWGSEYLGGHASSGTRRAGVNALTTPAFCPDSRQPELKHTAVKVLQADFPWRLVARAWLPGGEALATRQALAALMDAFPFALCVPFSGPVPPGAAAGPRTGVLLRAAAHSAPPEALLDRIEALLGLDRADTLRYQDRRHGQHRSARLERTDGPATLAALLLAGDTRADAWTSALLLQGLPAEAYGRQLLAPGAQPPAALRDASPAPGRQVCNCFGVTDTAIVHTLEGCEGSDRERLTALQGQLRCGTQCGSCLPALQRLVRTTPVGARATP